MDAMLTRIRFGREQPPPAGRRLRAGSLDLVLGEADLRYVRLGGREVIRRIYFAVRDPRWGTLPNRIESCRVDAADDEFAVDLRVSCREGPIDFAWRAEIRGTREGAIRFAVDGEARSAFLTCRIGLCVLHPIQECAGRPCRVTHADGSVTEGEFPRLVAPRQPFTDMAAIAHEVSLGTECSVRLEGDVFEMEDQRNWTDGSYKIYSRPLRLPFPFEVSSGGRIRQSVTIELAGSPVWRPRSEEEIVFQPILPACAPARLPAVGLDAGPHPESPGKRQVSLLEWLDISHLRVDLWLGHGGWHEQLARAAAAADALAVRLEIALHLAERPEEELRELRRVVDSIRPLVCWWLVFREGEPCTLPPWVDMARRILPPAQWIGGGSDTYFAELNRADVPLDLLDVICFPIDPQVHAFDNETVVESLAGQAAAIATAQQIAGDVPILVTPLTLAPRPPVPAGEPRGIPLADDRLVSLFGAAWTVGSLKRIVEDGVRSVTAFEVSGPCGVLATRDCPYGQEIGVPGAEVFPLYHVLADVREFRTALAVRTFSSRPLLVDGLAMRRGDTVRVLLANFTGQPRTVRLQGMGRRARVRRLDEENVAVAMESPCAYRDSPDESMRADGGSLRIELLPCAVARLDLSEE
ncbi:MAG: hypothetical protein JXA90_16470 [Planctomycetes bacterium]|nr:hypothetical protein [Planctomycetota bacterium]